MLHPLRSVLVLVLASPTAVVIGQTPSEVQKTQGFGGGGIGVAGVDIEGLDALRGSPGNDVEVYWRQNRNGVWSHGTNVSADGLEGGPNPLFGLSLAMDGDYCVVGAPLDDVNGIDRAGAAYFFILDRQSQQWVQLQRITASDPEVNDQFGRGIALDGNTLAIGALGRGDPSDGGVYMFELIEGVWQEKQFVLPSDLVGERSSFGISIALDAGRMAVGAPDSQRVFVFEKDQSGLWQETFRHRGFLFDGLAEFGYSVDLKGDRMVVGAPLEDFESDITDSGDFRIYDFDGVTWQITWGFQFNPPLEEYAKIGHSVALADDGNMVILGAPEGGKGFIGDGHARAFRFDGEEWTEISGSPFRPMDQGQQFEPAFGAAVATDGDWLVIGAPRDDGSGGGNNDQGAVYFYDLTGQMGTRCLLTDVSVGYGALLTGGLISLRDSDDSRYRIRSAFGFTSAEPNVADLIIGARNYVQSATSLRLLIEARLNHAGGTMRARLKNWNTNAYNTVGSYSIGTAENVGEIADIPAANYIRNNDQRIELSLRSSVVVVFSSAGFVAEHDFVNVLVKD